MGSASRSQYKHRRRTVAQKAAITQLNKQKANRDTTGNKENETPVYDWGPTNAVRTAGVLQPLLVQLQESEHVNDTLSSQLKKKTAEAMHLQKQVLKYRARHSNHSRRLRRAQRALEELRVKLKACDTMKRSFKRVEGERAAAIRREKRTREGAEIALTRAQEVNATLRDDVHACRRQIRMLQKQCARLPKQLAGKIEKAKSRPLTFRLMKKGVYSAQARALARLLVRAGVAQGKAGTLIQLFGRVLGISIKEKMSAHTVRRAVLEGGIASDIQMGYELKNTPSYTISGDATTDRHVNMESRFALVHAPESYGSSHSTHALLPKNRFLGIESAADHTSDTQVEGWKDTLASFATAYNSSPLGKRSSTDLDIIECAVKLKGMGGDHAADQLKTTHTIGTWKQDMTELLLSRTYLGIGKPTSSPQLTALVQKATDLATESVGGSESWADMDTDERMAIYVDHFNEEVQNLGRTLYAALPEDEKRPLDLFLRLGCAMHKDLNSVKGGNAAMMAEWLEIEGATLPLLLANKDNSSTLRDIDREALSAASLPSDGLMASLTPAERRALLSSTRGGIKLVSLAGAIFNHKDDKKGQHDTYVFYFEHVLARRGIRFPDTSNTRYQSYCVAAAELLVHREHYIRFLEVVRDRKEKPGFTNLEQNVYDGLNDPPTLTELAILAVYAEAVTHPYMRVARRTQNGLKLGPLHDQLKKHIKALVANPDLLLGTDSTSGYRSGALDGLEWEHPQVITAVLTLAPTLPHLSRLLRAFLEGALRTWDRFTVEFAPGGAIDRATEEELNAAYILPTNDHNEGALGGFRVWRRANPNGTLTYFNALKRFERNETAEFLDAHLADEENQKNLRHKGRMLDESGHERQRRRKLVEHALAIARARAREREEKARKRDEEVDRLRQVQLVCALEQLKLMKNPELEEQLEVYRKVVKDTAVPLKSKTTKRADKLAALAAAIERNAPPGENGH